MDAMDSHLHCRCSSESWFAVIKRLDFKFIDLPSSGQRIEWCPPRILTTSTAVTCYFLHPEQNATHLYSHAAAFAHTPLSLYQCFSGHSTTSLCCAHIDLTLLWGDSQLQKQVARSRCISLVHPIGPTVTTDSNADKVPLEGWKGHQH